MFVYPIGYICEGEIYYQSACVYHYSVHYYIIQYTTIIYSVYTLYQWFPNWGSRPTSGSPAIFWGVA